MTSAACSRAISVAAPAISTSSTLSRTRCDSAPRQHGAREESGSRERRRRDDERVETAEGKRGARGVCAHTEAVPIVGGTDFMVTWNLGDLNDRLVLDLSRLDEWSRIEQTAAGDGLRIG